MTTDMTLARARGDTGVERAASAADRALPGWTDRAVEAVRDFVRHDLAGMCGEFTIEDARRRAAESGLPDPTDGRAWGHVTRRAVKLGVIEPVPGKFSPTAASNGSPKQVYRRGRQA